jgi:hypothetical protein
MGETLAIKIISEKPQVNASTLEFDGEQITVSLQKSD